jgi:hypothetical protein
LSNTVIDGMAISVTYLGIIGTTPFSPPPSSPPTPETYSAAAVDIDDDDDDFGNVGRGDSRRVRLADRRPRIMVLCLFFCVWERESGG